jgi:putative addiction module component (TIGR02574 family)
MIGELYVGAKAPTSKCCGESILRKRPSTAKIRCATELARYNRVMTQQALDLLQKALSLSEEERADLACSLMESLDAAVEEGAESAWNEEIGRRITELDSGKAKTVPWEEVRRRISSRLTHGK